MADRSVVPDYFWVYHFHASYILQKYGDFNSSNVYLKAVDRIDEYNKKHGAELAKIRQTDNGETIIAICDNFSRRVHQHLPQAGDIVLVDATSNLDRHDTKLFHIICPSPAGGLPLGTILTSKEDENTVKAGFDLYKSILPPDAFFHRGEKGPKIAMTDDSKAEQNALRKYGKTSPFCYAFFICSKLFGVRNGTPITRLTNPIVQLYSTFIQPKVSCLRSNLF